MCMWSTPKADGWEDALAEHTTTPRRGSRGRRPAFSLSLAKHKHPRTFRDQIPSVPRQNRRLCELPSLPLRVGAEKESAQSEPE